MATGLLFHISRSLLLARSSLIPGMACIMYHCLLLSLAVLFQKTDLVKLAKIEYLNEDKSSKALAPLYYQSSASETDKRQKRFHKEDGKPWNGLMMLLPSYQVGNPKSPCLLFTVDAILSLKYVAKHEEQVRDIYIPAMPKVTGNCSDENEQNLAISWHKFVLTWFFYKLPEKGWWFLSKIELNCDPSDLFFDYINAEGISYTLSSQLGNSNPVVAAPIGKAFICSKEVAVNLTSSQINMAASLYMRSILLKPFIDDGSSFGEEYTCHINGSGSECKISLLTVGSMLAAVLTVSRCMN